MLDAFINDADNIARVQTVGDLVADVYRAGGKLLACGNGGSACDAMHLCEELTGRFRQDRRALPAIACTDPGHLTCTANDYGYDHVFARWVEALGQPGDVLIALSTSGNSPSVVNAVETAQKQGVLTVALLGNTGGQLANTCDHQWIVPAPFPTPSPATSTPLGSDRIQEIHMLILHALVERIETSLFNKSQ